MQSDLAKVLFTLRGRPLIHHVLEAVGGAGFSRTVVVVGHQHGRVRAALSGWSAEFVLQEPQLGTGHAVQCAAPLLSGFKGAVAVLAGDVPLIRTETLAGLMEHHHRTAAVVTVLTARLQDPTGYGRIVRDGSGRITAIVEEGDCRPAERSIREINSSIYAFDYPFLAKSLPRLGRENQQGEMYLTDTVGMAFAEGLLVEGIVVDDERELSGINTPEQLQDAEAANKEIQGGG
jgi:bifunctional UDP-N-acetylglucosamine pyrophosphorylase/glucosamine-1-phosphate N-acetyltransferase